MTSSAFYVFIILTSVWNYLVCWHASCLPSPHLPKLPREQGLCLSFSSPDLGTQNGAWYIIGTSWMNEWVSDCYLFVVILGDVILFSVFDFLTQSPLEIPCAAIFVYFPISSFLSHEDRFLFVQSGFCSQMLSLSPQPSWAAFLSVFVYKMVFIGSQLFEICTILFLAFHELQIFSAFIGHYCGKDFMNIEQSIIEELFLVCKLNPFSRDLSPFFFFLVSVFCFPK